MDLFQADNFNWKHSSVRWIWMELRHSYNRLPPCRMSEMRLIPIVTVRCAGLQFRMRMVSVSNLRPDFIFPQLSWLRSVPPSKCQFTPQRFIPHSFQFIIHYLPHHSIIWYVCVADNKTNITLTYIANIRAPYIIRIEAGVLIFTSVANGNKDKLGVKMAQNACGNDRNFAGLLPRRPGFDPRSVHVRFVVDKVNTGTGFLRVLRFYSASIIPPMFHIFHSTITDAMQS
jgi:hypothetical protein